MAAPYYEDDLVTLYHGDFRDCFPELDAAYADAIITDPPYGETKLAWDSWPDGWPREMQLMANSLWCFGSLRMFMDRLGDFTPWKFSHEIVWEKHNGSGFATDKFRRVHELATFWYQGPWGDVRHEVPRIPSLVPNKGGNNRRAQGEHMGKIANSAWADDGMRLQQTVIKVRSMQQNSVHPTQKPVGIITPLIEYSVEPGGMVIDPFAGSGTTLVAAKLARRRAVGAEANEAYCAAAARRLSQQAFDLEGIA